MEIKIYQATTNELDQRGSSVLITHNNKPSLVFKTKLRKNDTKKTYICLAIGTMTINRARRRTGGSMFCNGN